MGYAELRTEILLELTQTSKSYGLFELHGPFNQIAESDFVYKTDAQPYIDEAFTKLLTKTPNGLKFCAQLLFNNENFIFNRLGVSQKTAQKIADACQKNSPSIDPTPSQEALIRRVTGEFVREQKIAFGLQSEISSYTTAFYTILLIRNKDDLKNELFLEKSLAHELAIYFDEKSHPTLGAPDVHLNRVNQNSRQELQAILKNDPIRIALNMLRALRVEFEWVSELNSEIVSDLDYQDISHLSTSSVKCEDIVAKWVRQLWPLTSRFQNVHNLGVLIELVHKLSDIQVNLDDGTNTNACLYFTTPRLSEEFMGFSEGPRPRINSGWGIE